MVYTFPRDLTPEKYSFRRIWCFLITFLDSVNFFKKALLVHFEQAILMVLFVSVIIPPQFGSLCSHSLLQFLKNYFSSFPLESVLLSQVPKDITTCAIPCYHSL